MNDLLIAARFWVKVNVGRPGVCWPWQDKSRNENGYGIFRPSKDSGVIKAHRFAWEYANGPAGEHVVIRHTCDNPPCCNPAHLLSGSQAENVADMHERGRRKYETRITAERLEEILNRISRGETQKSIAADLGISQPYISMLASQKRGVTPRKVNAHGK